MALVGWLRLDDNANDSSRLENDSTTVNNITWVDGIIDKAASFNGSNSYIFNSNIPKLSTWNDSISIAVWIYIPTGAAFNNGFLSNIIGVGSYAGVYGIAKSGNVDNRISPYFRHNTGAISLNGDIVRDKWEHICITWDGHTHTLKLYINGTLQDSSVSSTTPTGIPDLSTINIGGNIGFAGANGTYYDGYMDDIRFYDNALSTKEVKLLSQGLVINSRFNGDVTDNSEFQYHGSGINTTYNSSIKRIGVSSLDQNPTGGIKLNRYVNYGNKPNITGNQTIAMWVYPQSFTTRQSLFDKGYGGEGAIVQETTGYITYYWGPNGNNSAPYQYSHIPPIPLNQWTHIAFLRNITGNDIGSYINGIRVASSPANYSAAGKSTMDLRLGDGYTSQYDGKIDDFRLYTTALSDNDILEIYQKGASLDNNGNFYVNSINETGHKSLLYDYTVWENGQTGSIGQFNDYGVSSNNTRIIAQDPWEKETVVWKSEPLTVFTTSTSNSSAGIYNTTVAIDNTKLYRISFWEKRVTNAGSTNSRYYVGLNGYGTTDGVIDRVNGGGANTNPYFWDSSSVPTQGELPLNEWVLVVGHVFPAGSGMGPMHPDSGRYTISGKYANNNSDWVWDNSTTTARPRTIAVYRTSHLGVIHYTAYPRMDVVDGTEPSIVELLNQFDSRNIDYIRNKGGNSNINLNINKSENIFGDINEGGVTNGISAWWNFNGNAKDISGNGNDGTVSGAEIVDGVNNSNAYYFDGSGTNNGAIAGDNISVNENITRTDNYPSGCTYSFWINVDISAVDRMSLFFGLHIMNHIEIYSISKYFRTEAALQNGYSFGTGTFPDNVRGTWSHFVIVFANNEPTRPVRWYQNGTLFHTGNMDGGTYPNTEYFSFNNIGRSTGSITRLYAPSFHGKIDDVRIYNRVLSTKEIEILYNITGGSTNKMKLSKYSIYIGNQIKEIF